MADYVPYNLQTATSEKSYWAAILAKKILIYVVCIFLTIMCIMPFFIMFVTATKTRGEISSTTLNWWGELNNKFLVLLLPSNAIANNWKILLSDQTVPMNLFRAFLNSFVISVLTTIFSVYFSSLTAYGFTAYRFKGNALLYGFIMLVLMVPTQVTVVAFINMVKGFGWDQGWKSLLPLILPAIAAPSTVFFMRQYMTSALSLEMVEAGRIDGCSEFGIYNRLVTPIMMPGMATMAIFGMITSWNNLFLPTILLSGDWRTIPIYVSLLSGNQFKVETGAIYLGLALTTLPLIIFYLILSRYIVAGVALGGVKE